MLPYSYQPAAALLLVVGGAIGAMVLQRYIIIVGTALVGAWTLIVGGAALVGNGGAPRTNGAAWILYPFTPAPGQRWLPIAFIALGVVGTAVQIGVTGRKRVPA